MEAIYTIVVLAVLFGIVWFLLKNKTFVKLYNAFAWGWNHLLGAAFMAIGVWMLFSGENFWTGLLGIGVGIYFFWAWSWKGLTRRLVKKALGADSEPATGGAETPAVQAAASSSPLDSDNGQEVVPAAEAPAASSAPMRATWSALTPKGRAALILAGIGVMVVVAFAIAHAQTSGAADVGSSSEAAIEQQVQAGDAAQAQADAQSEAQRDAAQSQPQDSAVGADGAGPGEDQPSTADSQNQHGDASTSPDTHARAIEDLFSLAPAGGAEKQVKVTYLNDGYTDADAALSFTVTSTNPEQWYVIQLDDSIPCYVNGKKVSVRELLPVAMGGDAYGTVTFTKDRLLSVKLVVDGGGDI